MRKIIISAQIIKLDFILFSWEEINLNLIFPN